MKLPDIFKEEVEKFIALVKKYLGSDSRVGKFVISMKNRMGIGSPERNATDTYERGMQIVPACISANENEIPVKQYNIAVLRNLLKFERAEGRMQVTNKRVVFRAAGRSVGGRTTLQHEFAIDEIAGIEARNNFKFSFMYLVFAVLILSLASLVLYQSPVNFRLVPPSFSLSEGISLPGIESNDAKAYRVYRMLNPKHVRLVYSIERAAISRTKSAEENIPKAEELVKTTSEAEEKAFVDVTRGGLQKTRRVQTGRDYWGDPIYSNQSYRDTSPAGYKEVQDILSRAITERERAEAGLEATKAELKAAKENQAEATKKREDTVKLWRVLMTIFGFILGIAGLIPFFMLNKKFGLKLFILNFSILGFTLSLAASGFGFFNFLLVLTNIILLVCVFLFCFRPNLVISIKNKGGVEAAVDIRRDTIFTKRHEKGTGFSEIMPTNETESAIREIGAIITDIQKLGDLGLEKWAKNRMF